MTKRIGQILRSHSTNTKVKHTIPILFLALLGLQTVVFAQTKPTPTWEPLTDNAITRTDDAHTAGRTAFSDRRSLSLAALSPGLLGIADRTASSVGEVEPGLRRFQMSFTVGVSFSKYGGDPSEFVRELNKSTGFRFEEKNRIGFPLSCDMNIYLKPWLSLKTGLQYTNKGMKFRENFKSSEYDFDLNITLISSYVEVPLLLELSTAPGTDSSGTRFFINGGITAGYLAKSKIWTEIGGEYGEGGVAYDQETEDWKEVHRFDYGYIFGLGCYLKGGVSLAVDYGTGLTTVSSEGWDFKNQSLSFKLGYFFQW